MVSLLLEEDRRGLEAARRSLEGIAQAASWVAETLAAGRVIMFAGAGTSGRLGILEAAECPPTFGTDPEQIRAVIAGGPEAVFAAREGAEDVSEDGARGRRRLGPGDLLIAMSASSVTPFVLGALASARTGGARTILVTCAPPGEMSAVADLVLALDTGPEVLTGSTRLKAGSATKAVLNAITTAAMVRLGKVYGNLMVDLRPGSAKLRDRALRIIEAAGAVSREEEQNGSTKPPTASRSASSRETAPAASIMRSARSRSLAEPGRGSFVDFPSRTMRRVVMALSTALVAEPALSRVDPLRASSARTRSATHADFAGGCAGDQYRACATDTADASAPSTKGVAEEFADTATSRSPAPSFPTARRRHRKRPPLPSRAAKTASGPPAMTAWICSGSVRGDTRRPPESRDGRWSLLRRTS